MLAVMNNAFNLQIVHYASVLLVHILLAVGKVIYVCRCGAMFDCKPDICPFVVRLLIRSHNVFFFRKSLKRLKKCFYNLQKYGFFIIRPRKQTTNSIKQVFPVRIRLYYFVILRICATFAGLFCR